MEQAGSEGRELQTVETASSRERGGRGGEQSKGERNKGRSRSSLLESSAVKLERERERRVGQAWWRGNGRSGWVQ